MFLKTRGAGILSNLSLVQKSQLAVQLGSIASKAKLALIRGDLDYFKKSPMDLIAVCMIDKLR